jgi:hypothetical protein
MSILNPPPVFTDVPPPGLGFRQARQLAVYLEGAGKRRAKLWELAPQLYCSLIGTCLSMGELRKLMAKWKGDDSRGASDLTVHEEAVSLAARQDGSARFLHKALDKRHELIIARFDKAGEDGELRGLWEDAKRNGDIAGAYWALLTHRAVSNELRQLAFADVHMLSHLVGAANRADIQRLATLEERNAELADEVEELRTALGRSAGQRDQDARLIEELQHKLAAQAREMSDRPAIGDDDPERVALRALAEELQRRLSTEVSRRERAEDRLEAADTALGDARRRLVELGEREQQLSAELGALEAHLSEGQSKTAADAVPAAAGLGAALKRTTLLCVGGQPGAVLQIRAFVEGLGGALIHHDGGIEERTALLPGLVSRADVVFFPVDCISHDAAGALKRLCRHAGKPYYPLRTASVASLAALLRAQCT